MMERGLVPEEEYTVPLGVADVKREGTDVTVVATGMMVKHALQTARKLEQEISVEVLELRTFEPLDLDAVLRSVCKTHCLVIVDEDTQRCGFAAELTALVVEKGFDLLAAPIIRVCNANCPLPGTYLEEHVLPNPQKIEAAIRRVRA